MTSDEQNVSSSTDAADGHAAPPWDGKLVHLDLELVRRNRDQPRKSFPARQMRELKESIRTVGLVQPIVVRPMKGGTFQIVAGERRFRAFKELAADDEQFGSIPAIVMERDDANAHIASLIENVVRDDLNPIERAQALEFLKEQLGATWEQVAERVGLTVRAVHHLRRTLKLRKEFREALAAGKINERQSRELGKLQIRFKDAAYELFEYILENPKLSAKDTEAVAKVLVQEPSYSAEEAHKFIKKKDDPAHAGKLPKLRSGPENTPFRQVMRGIKTVLGKTAELQFDELDEKERREVVAEAKKLKAWLEGIGI